MSKIRILPENLANQIAAGEVVERPASVVKELMENAIDSGARYVTVQVEGNGTRLIRIIDDGEGMDQDDILLSLERHATSKLGSEEELAAIKTLGFRGEAVPSIASVSRLVITSCQKDAALGARVEIRYGKIIKVHEMGCPKGTAMEVRDLFGNVPARKKFLKSLQTELFHVEEVVRNYALAFPFLGISYIADSRQVLDLPAESDSLEKRFRRLMALQSQNTLIGLDGHEGQAIRVSGFLLPPDAGHAARRSLRLFVNNRAVRDRMISHAVSEGLAGFLMKGRRPAGALFVTCPATFIDVNVHPTKQEVRFHKPQLVHQLVVAAVKEAMAEYQKTLKHSVFAAPHVMEATAISGTMTDAKRESARRAVPAEGKRSSWGQSALAFDGSLSEPAQDTWPQAVAGVPFPEARKTKALQGVSEGLASLDGDKQGKITGLATSAPRLLQAIGQIFNAYILCESECGLVVIDQHAAQERLLFEILKKQFSAKSVARQTLLFPREIELSTAEHEVLRRHGDDIARLGVAIEEFGGATFIIKAVPALMKHVPAEEIVAGIMEQFAGTPGERPARGARRMEHILSTMACKAAIKAGDFLEPLEIEHFLKQLQDADVFSHCPHGRPVFRCFTREEIGKWFCRT